MTTKKKTYYAEAEDREDMAPPPPPAQMWNARATDGSGREKTVPGPAWFKARENAMKYFLVEPYQLTLERA